MLQCLVTENAEEQVLNGLESRVLKPLNVNRRLEQGQGLQAEAHLQLS
jgi:hypothetical protein